METRQLEYFVAVAEELSFTRAAQRLQAVQSTVSAGVKSLESDLRTTLFDRSTRAVALTPAGAAFLPEAKAALAQLDRAKAVVQEAGAGLRGSLRIGTMISVGSLDLPGLLGAFHRRYPLVDLHLTMSTTGSTGLAEDVRAGRLDAALLGLPPSELAGLRARRLSHHSYVVLVPAEHRLAARAAVTITDLAGEDFVDTPRGFGNRIAVERAFEAVGKPRRVVAEVSDLRLVPDYVRAGLGIAVVPDLEIVRAPDLVRIELLDASVEWLVTLVWLADHRPSRALSTLLGLVEVMLTAGGDGE
ncbi:LysR family transcriptional regulator [Kutzneria kofuensis]|uniref:DNA-binding transcriptional LysR family regulator n=1 Tax=Kutzneria kofuensis TaxID=103725 RepID=A0A7W9NFN4_9PSEU|nr:LysR family transcriptional regulator [Kutzneria kofuensis]MBB5890301.1 DNA-binding transcriptional LysR family regulator [Kutzneria kofuensis]